jgi:hypothetical protein
MDGRTGGRADFSKALFVILYISLALVFVCLDRWIPVVKVITLQLPDCIGEGKIVSVIKLNTTP